MKPNMGRRHFLGYSVAGISGVGVTRAANRTENRLEIATEDEARRIRYEFTASGPVEAVTEPESIAAEPDGNDTVTERGDGSYHVLGITGVGDSDTWLVDGDLLTFDIVGEEELYAVSWNGVEISLAVNTNRLEIRTTEDARDVRYEFTASGLVKAVVQPEEIAAEPDGNDTITRRVDGSYFVAGVTGFGESDTWLVNGDVREFGVDASDDEYTVLWSGLPRTGGSGADGSADRDAETVEVDDDGEFCRYDNRITFRTQSDRHRYELAATGGIEQPNGQRVDSVTGSGPIDYDYAGEISSFAMRGRGRVTIRQRELCSDEDVTAGETAAGGGGDGFCEFNQTLSASTNADETATIKFGASHDIELSDGGRRVPATRFTVPANGRETFAYAGWLTSLSIDGAVDVRIEQSAPCADEYAE